MSPAWPDILLRMLLAFAAGLVIGFDRERQNHAAGLRTTVLVVLAAAVAMIQADLLLPTAGKGPASFATMDVMRLPLGILTGVGFIGGGAILKQGGSVRGVTTAATLWVVTAIGLCFGGGQIGLGLTATALALATIFGMKRIDRLLPRHRAAMLTLAVPAGDRPPDPEGALAALGCRATLVGQRAADDRRRTEVRYRLRWVQTGRRERAGEILTALRDHEVLDFELAGD